MTIETDLVYGLKLKGRDYLRLENKWIKTNTIYEGEDSVHDSGELLLKKLPLQTVDMYLNYVERARFFNIFKRTISGFEGQVSKKEPSFEVDTIETFIDNIDYNENDIHDYGKLILHQVLKVGICGTLVDYNRTLGDTDSELTVAQVESMKLRPKLVFYNETSILDYRYKVIEGINKLVFVKLLETYIKPKNEFEEEELDQYRVLRINESGKYEQQLYRVDETGGIEISEPMLILINGNQIDEIPFFFHGKYQEPPLYDLVTSNIKHYQLQADYNHALHYIGLPTAWRTGVDPNDNKLPNAIGPEVIWDFEKSDAKCGYLELTGKGLDYIVKELETIKEDMAFLGANFLASDQFTNETATKSKFRNSAESSSLSDLVLDLSQSYTRALQFFSLWANGSEDEKLYYDFNTDFDIIALTAQDILARVQAWQTGAFSKASLFAQLKEGEIKIVSDNFEDEEELINKEPPPVRNNGVNNGDDSGSN